MLNCKARKRNRKHITQIAVHHCICSNSTQLSRNVATDYLANGKNKTISSASWTLKIQLRNFNTKNMTALRFA